MDKKTEKYFAETGLGDVWRSVLRAAHEHVGGELEKVKPEHAGLVVKVLLSVAAHVAQLGATADGEPIDVDTFAAMAHDVFGEHARDPEPHKMQLVPRPDGDGAA